MKTDPDYQAKWLNLVNQYKLSNQTMKQFSYGHHVKVHQLQYWLKKYNTKTSEESNQFIEVKIDDHLKRVNPI